MFTGIYTPQVISTVTTVRCFCFVKVFNEGMLTGVVMQCRMGEGGTRGMVQRTVYPRLNLRGKKMSGYNAQRKSNFCTVNYDITVFCIPVGGRNFSVTRYIGIYGFQMDSKQ